MKRKYKNLDDEQEEKEESSIKVFDNCVYFYAEVSKENIIILREKIEADYSILWPILKHHNSKEITIGRFFLEQMDLLLKEQEIIFLL